jgi:hypothetical protein
MIAAPWKTENRGKLMVNGPGATKKLSIFVILVFIALMIFVFIHPPFFATSSFRTEHQTTRLLFEGFILFSLSLYLLKGGAEIFVVLFVVFFLYMMNWFFSVEKIENALSYFNKFAFLLLISSVLCRKNNLARVAKNIWITFWVYCSIMGIIGYFLMVSNLVSPTIIVGEEEGWGHYLYYNYPLIGNFFIKTTDLFSIPRYTGLLSEPVMLGLFFGFNMVVAKQLVADTKKCRHFLRLNMVAGLLTISYVFIIFLAFFLCSRSRIVTRLVFNKPIVLGFIVFICLIIIITASTTSIYGNIDELDELLPYSSLGVRVQQYVSSIEVINEQSLIALVFGLGIIPFHEAIGGGASAGIIDVLVSRGIILWGIWLYVLYRKAKHIPGLFAFILLYSLVLDYWHFPLFIIGLAIVASLDAKCQGRTAPSF